MLIALEAREESMSAMYRKGARGVVVVLLAACMALPAVGSAAAGDSMASPMTPEAKSALESCVAQSAELAGDTQEHRVTVGVFIGSNGRAANLAILESSGLEHLDKLVLRCLARTSFMSPKPGQGLIQWVFRTVLKPKHAAGGANV